MADDDLKQRWQAANRVPDGIAHTHASRALMDEVRARIVASERPLEERRRRMQLPRARRGIALGWAIGVLIVGGAAAATVATLTYTIDGAPGSCQALAAATASVRYPPGAEAWRNWVLLRSIDPKLGMTLHQACTTREYMGHGSSYGPVAEVVRVYKREVVQSAFCAWANQWLKAKRTGDKTVAANAADAIEGALQWPMLRYLEQARPHWLGLYLPWLIPAQRAVRAGDVAKVASMWSNTGQGPLIYQCWFLQPPANSNNGTVLVRTPIEYAK